MKLMVICLIRILLAAACGIAIGTERHTRSKEAGVRTHCVVACGAALMMVVSKYGFFDLPLYAGELSVGLDPSRVAASIVTGVGFLGAGIIFIQKNTITGLTTAAGIWTTSGIGMAIGAGMYWIGVAVTVLLLAVQILVHKRSGWVDLPNKARTLSVFDVTETEFQQYAVGLLAGHGVSVQDTYISKQEDTRTYRFSIEFPSEVSEEEIIGLFSQNCSLTD